MCFLVWCVVARIYLTNFTHARSGQRAYISSHNIRGPLGKILALAPAYRGATAVSGGPVLPGNVRAYAREDMAGSHRELSEDIIGIKKLASRAQNLIACVQRLVMARQIESHGSRPVGDGGAAERRKAQVARAGCKTLLLEIFAGVAILTMLAISAGWPIIEPIDTIYEGQHVGGPDLTVFSNRKRVDQLIEERDPFCVVIPFLC